MVEEKETKRERNGQKYSTCIVTYVYMEKKDFRVARWRRMC